MLMAAGTHIVGSSSTSPPSPWHPVILVPNQAQQQQHQVLYDDLDLASPPRPRHNSHHHRPAASRGKQPRRPRPSRKLPTTYISADAASFRRMVHQVTGADDVHVPLLHLPGGPAAPGTEVLCRQAPAPHSRAGLTRTTRTEMLLPPTLDTSAFLMLGAAGGGAARPAVSCCHGSAAAAAELQVKAEDACGCGGCRRR